MKEIQLLTTWRHSLHHLTKAILFMGLVFVLTFNTTAQNAGNCLSYNGVNQQTSLGNPANLQLTTYTIEVWFFGTDKTKGILTRGVTRGVAGSRIFDLYGNGTNLILVLGDNASGSQGFTIGAYVANVWNHVAIVNNGTSVTTYLNGANPVTTNLTITPEVTTINWYIGGNYSYYHSGRIDELRIWSSIRTQAEIQSTMFKPLTGSEANLVAYYNFNASSGTTLDDQTSPQENGTNNNSPTWVTSYLPFGDATSQTQTEVKAIWQGLGTNTSLESGGMTGKVSATLTEPNYSLFGHNNTNGVTTADLTGTTAIARYNRIWYASTAGTVSNASLTYDLGTISGSSITVTTPSNYVLLYRSGTSGNFTNVTTASSVANSDQITFTGVNFQTGYYAVGNSVFALPIELLDFKATPSVSGNLLTWQTAKEMNNKGFEVERFNPNTETWDKLGFITGNNKAATYNFTDNTPLRMSYYRLRQIDNDGKETLSKVISVATNKNSKLIIYPNPVATILTVEQETISDYHIFNLVGQEVMRGTVVRSIDVSSLPQGVYTLKISKEQVRFVKQ